MANWCRGGFLLIEVVMAMAILVVVTVGLYQVMRASITAAEEIRRSKQRSEQLAGLVELVRRSMDALPKEATITSSVREGAGGMSQALTVADAPVAFAFGRGGAHYGPKSLILVPQVGGLFSLAVEYEPDPEARRQSIEKPQVLVLLGDVRGIEWMFYDERLASWIEKWENPSMRPGLLRMNLSLPGEEAPYTATFRIPAGGVTPASAMIREGDEGGNVQKNQASPADQNGSAAEGQILP